VAEHLRLSPLKIAGWNRHHLDDRDPRMAVSTSGHPGGMFDGDNR